MSIERRPRTWAAALTLYFLAPILGEVFSFNTPPLAFVLDPSKFIFEPALYGSGALLIREVARRRGLGWSAILLMGAAYGVLEEGVFIHSWFNPTFEGLHNLAIYGRAWDTNWVWAFGLTGFHAVFSIAIPILLAEAMYPRVAALPWLNRFWLRADRVLVRVHRPARRGRLRLRPLARARATPIRRSPTCWRSR